MARTSWQGTKTRRDAPSLRAAALAGAVATYGMDAAGGRIATALEMKPPSGLGRWVGHMFRGRFTHEDITTSAPVAHEPPSE